MAKKQPNSVLFSLEELRRIEEERVADEEKKKRDAIEAANRAREEAVQREKEAALRKQQEDEERQRKEQEAQEAAEREERLRLAEAERRARIDAEMKLQQHRIAMEAEAAAKVKAHKLRNTILVITGSAVLALAGLGYFLHKKSEEKAQAEQARQAIANQIEDLKREFAAREERFKAEQEGLEDKMAELNDTLKSAKNDARRELLRKQRAALLEKQRNLAERRAKARAAAKRRAKRLNVGGGDDPLGSLKL
jgi:hypothetical protein